MTTRRQMLLVLATLALIPFLPETKPLYSIRAREDDINFSTIEDEIQNTYEADENDSFSRMSNQTNGGRVQSLPLIVRRQSPKGL